MNRHRSMKMTNLYVLEKRRVTVSDKARRAVRIAVHSFFLLGEIGAAIGILGMIAGAEFGPVDLGRRLVAVVCFLVMLGACALGARLTYVELPWDGGEEDE